MAPDPLRLRTLSPEVSAGFRERFREQHAVMVRDGLPEARPLLRAIRPERWASDDTTGAQFVFRSQPVPQALQQAWAAPEVLSWVEKVTGVVGLRSFQGVFKELTSASGQRFPWHRDHRGGQVLGMSLNLSLRPFQGGEFQQRWKWDKALLCELHPSSVGDVHFIDVAQAKLVHRVAPVRGDEPRVFLAGWFYRGQ